MPLFPVSNFLGKSPTQLTYSPWSIHSIVNTFLLVFGATELVLVINYGLYVGYGFSSLSSILFFLVTLAAAIAMRILATNWAVVMRRWDKLEKTFLKFPYKPPQYNLAVMLTGVAGCMYLFMVCKYFSNIT